MIDNIRYFQDDLDLLKIQLGDEIKSLNLFGSVVQKPLDAIYDIDIMIEADANKHTKLKKKLLEIKTKRSIDQVDIQNYGRDKVRMLKIGYHILLLDSKQKAKIKPITDASYGTSEIFSNKSSINQKR